MFFKLFEILNILEQNFWEGDYYMAILPEHDQKESRSSHVTDSSSDPI